MVVAGRAGGHPALELGEEGSTVAIPCLRVGRWFVRGALARGRSCASIADHGEPRAEPAPGAHAAGSSGQRGSASRRDLAVPRAAPGSVGPAAFVPVQEHR